MLEHLEAAKLVDASAVARAELVAVRTGQPVEQVLNNLGSLSDDDLAKAYAEVIGCELWDPARTPIAVDVQALGIAVDYLRRARIAPLSATRSALTCAACDPLDDEALSGLAFATGHKIKVLVARTCDCRQAFDLAFSEPANDAVVADERRLEREIDQVADGVSEGSGARWSPRPSRRRSPRTPRTSISNPGATTFACGCA